MKKSLLHIIACLVAVMGFARAGATSPVVNITPAPATMTVGEGSFTIPQGFTVALDAGLPADMATEADKFVEVYAAATGNQGRVVTGTSGAFTVSLDSKVAPEGYTLKVTPSGVAVTASAPTGLYYAFQSIRKMLPANVMAGMSAASPQVYALPVVDIADEPRYSYRGFMLDVSRHFFDVKEIKRILDLMSFYKLNSFHFHLTDDQGWRFPVEKYPLLTTIGAVAPNAQFVDMKTKTEVWLNRPYGPFSYTKEELLDLVDYAAERHIDIIPEVEMPGHFSAAITAYPFLSCDPEGSHSVAQTGGIYNDVLNIGNPAAVTFAKDVLTELMDIFPSKRIHIGGDECPDTRWKSNIYCQNLMTRLGLTDYRALQSHFTEELAAFAAERGRELIVWNESLTAGGTDLAAIKRANPIVMCWTGANSATDMARNNGLRYIFTPQGSFYVNRRLPGDDIPANGGGDCSPTQIYNTQTPTGDLCAGIQGTFWSERVATPDYLEYLLLPRLMAIAENAWTPVSSRNYDLFTKRMSADATLLTMLGYNFYTGPAGGIAVPSEGDVETETDPREGHWYQLLSQGGGNGRNGQAMELLAEGHSLIGTGNAQAGRLWLNAPASATDSNHDAQLWQFEKGSNGLYALVNKSKPAGSVKPAPTATNNTGRWDYDASAKHYNFSIDDAYRATTTDGATTIALKSDQASGVYVNAALGGQNFAVNCYGDPSDGNGGIWKLADADGTSATDPEPSTSTAVPFAKLAAGKTYTFANAVIAPTLTYPTFIADLSSDRLGHSADPAADNIWRVASATDNADGTQSVTLVNLTTSRAIAAPTAFEAGYGMGATLGSVPSALTVNGVTPSATISLGYGAATLWPLPDTSRKYPSTIAAGNSDNAALPAAAALGAEWIATEVTPVTFICQASGKTIATMTVGIPVGSAVDASTAPVIPGYAFVSATAPAGGSVTATYKRTSYSITFTGSTTDGALLPAITVEVPADKPYTVAYPERPAMTLVEGSLPQGARLDLTDDMTVPATYSTDAVLGIMALGEPVKELKAGNCYVVYDSHSDRNAYRVVAGNIVGGKRSLPLGPEAVWQFKAADGGAFALLNPASGMYVGTLPRGASCPLSATPVASTFVWNVDHWTIRQGEMTWDGGPDFTLHGWSGDGHPYQIYEFIAAPYYEVTSEAYDEAGNHLGSSSAYGAAGENFFYVAPAYKGYYLKSMEGHYGLDNLLKNHTVRLVYSTDPTTGLETVTAPEVPVRSRGIYDLNGHRLDRVTAPGVYIIDGVKTLVR